MRGTVALVGTVFAAEVALQLPPVRELLRGRAEDALSARWPGATIARCAAADVTGVVRFDGVRLPAGERAAVVLDGLEAAVRWRSLLRGRIEPARVEAADTFLELDAPRVGKIGVGADEGAALRFAVVELPARDSTAPVRVRLSGPARACLPSGRCLLADVFLEGEAARAAGGVQLRFQALADGGRVVSPDASEPPVAVPPLAAHGDASFTRSGGESGGRTSALDTQISVGPHGTVDVAARAAAGSFDLEVNSRTPRYGLLLASLPLGLEPESWLGVDGAVEAYAHVSGPIADPTQWVVDARLDLDALRAAARESGAGEALKAPFLYRPLADPSKPEIWMGAANRDFVPLEDVPEVVVRSVLLSEDSFFETHEGFDTDAIVEAMKVNLKEKRVRRGGSTVSQQLAKNLWLSREKTLLRKVQEALLTVALEAALPKERILEIYLNGIEWGPGMYGVKRAARHYFDKELDELTPKEAAYLATVIPNPRRYYGWFRKGAISERWEARVMHLVGKLREAGTIDDAAVEEAAWTPLRFASSGDDPWTETVETPTVEPIDEDGEAL